MNNNIVFNKSIAARVLNILPHQIKRVEEWSNCVYVLANKVSKFISKKTFYFHFIESRKERAKTLTVEKISTTEYIVSNPENGNSYLIKLNGKNAECGCEDYKNQLAFFGKGACKHIYAALFLMGFDSLGEYQNTIKEE